MIMKLEEADIEAIASRVAEKLGGAANAPRKPYTVAEAAELAGMHPRTLRKAVDAGKLPRVPGTDRYLIPAAALDAFLNGGNASAPVRPVFRSLAELEAWRAQEVARLKSKLEEI